MIQQSKNWEQRNAIAFQGVRFQGFPFMEGLPKNRMGTYEIILADGERAQAMLDLSTQYRAEGIQWRTLDGRIFHPHVIACWRSVEIQEP